MSREEIIEQIVGNTDAFIRQVQETDSVLNNVILPFPEDFNAMRQFAVTEYWSDAQIVNVFEVVGTAHADYIGATWISMLRLGSNMQSVNLPLLRENPGYYFDLAKKVPDVNYTLINGKLYISGKGNHRTSIAKALFAFLGLQNFGAVKYEEYLVDEEALRLYQETSRLLVQKAMPMQLEPVKTISRREDTPGWKKDFYSLSFRLANVKTGEEKFLSKEELRDFYRALENISWFSRITGRYGNLLA